MSAESQDVSPTKKLIQDKFQIRNQALFDAGRLGYEADQIEIDLDTRRREIKKKNTEAFNIERDIKKLMADEEKEKAAAQKAVESVENTATEASASP